MTHNASDHETGIVALGRLADELTARGYEARLAAPGTRRPSLAVRNPAAPVLSDRVIADADWFWWSWADRIAPVADVAAAAERVIRVLAEIKEPAHD